MERNSQQVQHAKVDIDGVTAIGGDTAENEPFKSWETGIVFGLTGLATRHDRALRSGEKTCHGVDLQTSSFSAEETSKWISRSERCLVGLWP